MPINTTSITLALTKMASDLNHLVSESISINEVENVPHEGQKNLLAFQRRVENILDKQLIQLYSSKYTDNVYEDIKKRIKIFENIISALQKKFDKAEKVKFESQTSYEKFSELRKLFYSVVIETASKLNDMLPHLVEPDIAQELQVKVPTNLFSKGPSIQIHTEKIDSRSADDESGPPIDKTFLEMIEENNKEQALILAAEDLKKARRLLKLIEESIAKLPPYTLEYSSENIIAQRISFQAIRKKLIHFIKTKHAEVKAALPQLEFGKPDFISFTETEIQERNERIKKEIQTLVKKDKLDKIQKKFSDLKTRWKKEDQKESLPTDNQNVTVPVQAILQRPVVPTYKNFSALVDDIQYDFHNIFKVYYFEKIPSFLQKLFKHNASSNPSFKLTEALAELKQYVINQVQKNTTERILTFGEACDKIISKNFNFKNANKIVAAMKVAAILEGEDQQLQDLRKAFSTDLFLTEKDIDSLNDPILKTIFKKYNLPAAKRLNDTISYDLLQTSLKYLVISQFREVTQSIAESRLQIWDLVQIQSSVDSIPAFKNTKQKLLITAIIKLMNLLYQMRLTNTDPSSLLSTVDFKTLQDPNVQPIFKKFGISIEKMQRQFKKENADGFLAADLKILLIAHVGEFTSTDTSKMTYEQAINRFLQSPASNNDNNKTKIFAIRKAVALLDPSEDLEFGVDLPLLPTDIKALQDSKIQKLFKKNDYTIQRLKKQEQEYLKSRGESWFLHRLKQKFISHVQNILAVKNLNTNVTFEEALDIFLLQNKDNLDQNYLSLLKIIGVLDDKNVRQKLQGRILLTPADDNLLKSKEFKSLMGLYNINLKHIYNQQTQLLLSNGKSWLIEELTNHLITQAKLIDPHPEILNSFQAIGFISQSKDASQNSKLAIKILDIITHQISVGLSYKVALSPTDMEVLAGSDLQKVLQRYGIHATKDRASWLDKELQDYVVNQGQKAGLGSEFSLILKNYDKQPIRRTISLFGYQDRKALISLALKVKGIMGDENIQNEFGRNILLSKAEKNLLKETTLQNLLRRYNVTTDELDRKQAEILQITGMKWLHEALKDFVGLKAISADELLTAQKLITITGDNVDISMKLSEKDQKILKNSKKLNEMLSKYHVTVEQIEEHLNQKRDQVSQADLVRDILIHQLMSQIEKIANKKGIDYKQLKSLIKDGNINIKTLSEQHHQPIVFLIKLLGIIGDKATINCLGLDIQLSTQELQVLEAAFQNSNSDLNKIFAEYDITENQIREMMDLRLSQIGKDLQSQNENLKQLQQQVNRETSHTTELVLPSNMNSIKSEMRSLSHILFNHRLTKLTKSLYDALIRREYKKEPWLVSIIDDIKNGAKLSQDESTSDLISTTVKVLGILGNSEIFSGLGTKIFLSPAELQALNGPTLQRILKSHGITTERVLGLYSALFESDTNLAEYRRILIASELKEFFRVKIVELTGDKKITTFQEALDSFANNKVNYKKLGLFSKPITKEQLSAVLKTLANLGDEAVIKVFPDKKITERDKKELESSKLHPIFAKHFFDIGQMMSSQNEPIQEPIVVINKQ